MSTASNRRFHAGSFRAKMAIILAVSLLPLGLISVVQTHNAGKEAQGLSRAALLAATERAATEERTVMKEALGAAEALGHVVVGQLDDPASCSQQLSDYISRVENRIFAGFIDTNGLMQCSSTGSVVDFSENADFLSLMDAPGQRVQMNERGAVTQEPVVITTAPIYDEGTLRGFMSLSVPRDLMRSVISEDIASRDDFAFALFTRDGQIIGANSGADDFGNLLPRDVPLTSFVDSQSTTFVAASIVGQDRHYAVVPVLNGNIYALSSWEPSHVWYAGGDSYLLPLMFPLLMLLVSVIVAYSSVSRLMIRPVNDLRNRMHEFEQGRRDFRSAGVMHAPTEFQELAASFLSMVRTIADDEVEREKALQDKNMLLREVYHRVKNNLQLIVSIMNMQIRNAATPREKLLLQQLQERVMSLSVVHKNLYQASSLASVRADHLLSEVVTQLVGLGAGKPGRINVETDFDPITLYPDQAVPVALLITEAGTNALKYIGQSNSKGVIRFRMKSRPDGMVEMAVENTVGTPEEGISSTGLGSRLIDAFARQLAAQIEREQTENSFALRLVFPLADTAEEAEKAGAADAEPQSGPATSEGPDTDAAA